METPFPYLMDVVYRLSSLGVVTFDLSSTLRTTGLQRLLFDCPKCRDRPCSLVLDFVVTDDTQESLDPRTSTLPSSTGGL